MKRRTFLQGMALATGAVAAARLAFGRLKNPCLDGPPPREIFHHDIVQDAWEGIDPARFMDVHAHLLGLGDAGSGAWVNPAMKRFTHPLQYVAFQAYLNASCPTPGKAVDVGFVERLEGLMGQFPPGAKILLFAFDYYHDENGRAVPEGGPYHIPNRHAAAVAQSAADRFRWAASVHPYREDCVEALQEAKDDGAIAVKWLPQAMGIDPASERCDRAYETIAALGLPLICHMGDEKATHGQGLQSWANPLRLRRALERGVTVIVAHCGSFGENEDSEGDGRLRSNFDFFLRLMEDPSYHGRLYGDISGILLRNRVGRPLYALLERDDLHPRLLNGSDYPLPGVIPLTSLSDLEGRQLITEEERELLATIQWHNPLLFDFVLKRTLRFKGHRFPPIVFETERVFP